MFDISWLFDVTQTFFTVLDHPVSYVEFIGTVLGLISVFLAARANIFTWPTGIANAIFFLVIFYQIQLYSDMFLQMYFCCMGVYGWFTWKYRAEHQQSAIRTLSNANRLKLAGLIAAAVLLIGTLISQIHLLLPQIFQRPATFPYIDTFIAVSSVLAVILLARRIFETWVLWILVDITSIGLYYVKGVKLIAVEYVIFLALAILGVLSWYKLWRSSDAETVE
jgi:nicotinamide mononucleotide transporter